MRAMARVLLGVTGGIAAYKACEVCRLLVRAGHDVVPLVTPGAERFVTAETFRALARRPPAEDVYLHLTRADLLLVAPCTANTLAKLAHGIADNVLTEAAQTVDDVVVIHNGRLAFEGAIGELTRLGGSRVAAGTPNPERLASAAREAGGRVQLRGTRVLIEGMDAAQVGELAHREGVRLHELASDDASLEQVFFSLTEEEAA